LCVAGKGVVNDKRLLYICIMNHDKKNTINADVLFDIEGYEGLYSVTTKGDVYSWGKGKSFTSDGKLKMIKHTIKANGYVQVKLFKNGERKYFNVHRLVAKCFIPNPENKREVNHKDGNKQNNEVSNLEWVTTRENQLHAFALGLQVAPRGKDSTCSIPINQYQKDGTFVKQWESINTLKREMGFNSFGIIGCCKMRKKYKTAYGFKWEYATTNNSAN
jgi:hypothetical protein